MMVDIGVIEQLRAVPIFRGVDEVEPYVGEMAMIDGKPRSGPVNPESPTTFPPTSRQFLPVFDGCPSISRALLVELPGRLRRVENDPVG